MDWLRFRLSTTGLQMDAVHKMPPPWSYRFQPFFDQRPCKNSSRHLLARSSPQSFAKLLATLERAVETQVKFFEGEPITREILESIVDAVRPLKGFPIRPRPLVLPEPSNALVPLEAMLSHWNV